MLNFIPAYAHYLLPVIIALIQILDAYLRYLSFKSTMTVLKVRLSLKFQILLTKG
ncbi:MAG: hypothetical protein J6I62_09560 [Selenomonadaceae bacterium]|nr:hypothetical protein [Selenomonadaceae bacterium]